MNEQEIAEAILTGSTPNINESKVKEIYRERLDNIVDGIKDKEYAVPTIICGITGKECNNGGRCSTCIVALEAMTKASDNMLERELDAIRFQHKNGYMATPSEQILRFRDLSEMLEHFKLKEENLIPIKKEDMYELIQTLQSVHSDIMSIVLDRTDKYYIVQHKFVFEKEGGSVIVYVEKV